MATQVKKVIDGVFPAQGGKADAPEAVRFVGPEGVVFGEVTLAALGLPDNFSKKFPMAARLVKHAISQKVGDSYAGAADAENPLQYVKDAIAATIDQIMKGEWRVVTAGGFRISDLARALARVTGNTPEDAQAVIDANSDLDDDGKPSEAGKDWLKKVKGQKSIKDALLAIQSERLEARKAKGTKGEEGADLAGLFQKS